MDHRSRQSHLKRVACALPLALAFVSAHAEGLAGGISNVALSGSPAECWYGW